MYKVYIVYNISLTLINNTMHIQLIQANPRTQIPPYHLYIHRGIDHLQNKMINIAENQLNASHWMYKRLEFQQCLIITYLKDRFS